MDNFTHTKHSTFQQPAIDLLESLGYTFISPLTESGSAEGMPICC